MSSGIIRSLIGIVAGLIVAQAGFAVGPAHAAGSGLIWYGDPAKGESVFKINNCASPGSVSVVADPTNTYGKVWLFDKPSGDNRCEEHGAAGFTPVQGGTYYIGWRARQNSMASDNANFQWKAYGQPMTQDFPFTISNSSVGTGFWYEPQHGTPMINLWHDAAFQPLQWHSYVIAYHVSVDPTQGWTSLWIDGHQQSLLGKLQYPAKTFDGSAVDPKWGVYGASTTHYQNWVEALRVGTTYASAAPELN